MSLDDRRDRIRKTGPEHIWAQVASDIRSDINAKRLRSGDKLPSEYELAEQYGVARVTIRRAIQELVSENRVTIVRGRGTYIV
jgi:GntR family transcriptional regulator